MARTAVNARLTGVTTYTVPVGKMLICKAFGTGAPGTNTGDLRVNGAIIADLTDVKHAGPICANAGDVLSNSDPSAGSEIGISGFLYDV